MRLLDTIKYLREALPTLAALRSLKADSEETVADHLEAVVDEHGHRVALLHGEQRYTYRDLDHLANQFANHFADAGVRPGEVVALDMENRPEYVAIWFGLAKIGVTTALINTNLSGPQLTHCLDVAEPSHIIVGAERADSFASARSTLRNDATVWSQGGSFDGADGLDAAVRAASTERPSRQLRTGQTLGGTDLFYIYTSGTTGLPKAAHFSHLKFLSTAKAASTGLRFTPDDVQYVCLPLYHTAGGVMAIGAALLTGASAVLVPKFSASRFWKDCVHYGVTSFQYIGELMRYLVNSEPVPEERQHQVTKCIGNGLRPEIWDEVVERFGIDRVIEFYGATEGNVAMVNLDGKRGSVGRMPRFIRKAVGVTLVKYDVEGDEVVRGPDGFCVEAGPGEIGEAVGKIPKNAKSATGRFEGYSDPEATERKILRDVFEKGDQYFRTGDLLRYDEDEYFYFVDRIGDTFRWKGENVATTEVAEVISVLPDVAEANVYGVQIPGTDGRAGMAAIVPDGDGVDLARLYETTERDLAAYARPVFVRIQHEMQTTGTFKHRKVDLVDEGYDPSRTGDDLYFRDVGAGRYVPLDRALADKIDAGDIRI